MNFSFVPGATPLLFDNGLKASEWCLEKVCAVTPDKVQLVYWVIIGILLLQLIVLRYKYHCLKKLVPPELRPPSITELFKLKDEEAK
jgi:hypothetical protein